MSRKSVSWMSSKSVSTADFYRQKNPAVAARPREFHNQLEYSEENVFVQTALTTE